MQLTTEDLKLAQKNIKSISSTLKERIQEIKKAVENMDLKSASNPENKIAKRPTLKRQVEKENNQTDAIEDLEKVVNFVINVPEILKGL